MASFRNLLGLPVKDWDSRASGQVLQLSSDKEHWEFGAGGGGGTASPLTTKGDLYGYDTDNARLPVGTDGQVLMADSSKPLGVKWAEGSGIHIDDRVATYANLPSPPPAGYTTYLVEADGLIYVWNGSAWPAVGDGVAIGNATKAWRIHVTDTNGGNFGGLWSVETGLLQFLNSAGGVLSLGVDVFATYGTLAQPIRSLCGTFFGEYWVDNSATSRAAIDAYAGYMTVRGRVDKVAITARNDAWNSTIQQFHPRDFTVQSSTDTTTGLDGTWADEWSVSGVTGWTQGGVKTFTRP